MFFLFFIFLKSTYFKKNHLMVASKWSLCGTENNTWENNNYVQCLNIAPMGKAWYMALREYNPNGKGKVVPMEFTLMVYSSYEKGMVL